MVFNEKILFPLSYFFATDRRLLSIDAYSDCVNDFRSNKSGGVAVTDVTILGNGASSTYREKNGTTRIAVFQPFRCRLFCSPVPLT